MGSVSDAWWVYVLVSSEGRTYVGITNDLSRRLDEHNGVLPGGAKATRRGRPWSIGQRFGPLPHRGDALRVEARIKRRTGMHRLAPFDIGSIVDSAEV